MRWVTTNFEPRSGSSWPHASSTAGSWSLKMRSPSAFVRGTIGVCGLDNLLDPSAQEACDGAGEALGSWVAVSLAEGAEREPQPSSTAALHLPADVGHVAHLGAAATLEHKQLAEIA
jgi:hypothetical protein